MENEAARLESEHPALQAPFPWFGGKSRVAHLVWSRFGRVPVYVEPFFGSGAVLLGRPTAPGIETVNDRDGMLANAWRAIQHDPEETAYWADRPVNENDLHAIHAYLVPRRSDLTARLEGDPDYFDAKLAGWWLWGILRVPCANTPHVFPVRIPALLWVARCHRNALVARLARKLKAIPRPLILVELADWILDSATSAPLFRWLRIAFVPVASILKGGIPAKVLHPVVRFIGVWVVAPLKAVRARPDKGFQYQPMNLAGSYFPTDVKGDNSVSGFREVNGQLSRGAGFPRSAVVAALTLCSPDAAILARKIARHVWDLAKFCFHTSIIPHIHNEHKRRAVEPQGWLRLAGRRSGPG